LVLQLRANAAAERGECASVGSAITINRTIHVIRNDDNEITAARIAVAQG
jgi:hypothetical protein